VCGIGIVITRARADENLGLAQIGKESIHPGHPVQVRVWDPYDDRGIDPVEVLHVQLDCSPDLLKVGEAGGLAGFLPSGIEGRKQKGRENAYNDDHNEQFHQSETRSSTPITQACHKCPWFLPGSAAFDLSAGFHHGKAGLSRILIRKRSL